MCRAARGGAIEKQDDEGEQSDKEEIWRWLKQIDEANEMRTSLLRLNLTIRTISQNQLTGMRHPDLHALVFHCRC